MSDSVVKHCVWWSQAEAAGDSEDSVLQQLAANISSTTPYELHSSQLPCALLQWLTAAGEAQSQGRWTRFEQSFGADSEPLQLLVERLQHIVSECEDLPVYTQPDHRFGLSTILQTCELTLTNTTDGASSTIQLQPLVQMLQIKQQMIRTAAVDCPLYLEWCSKLLGAEIVDRGMVCQLPQRNSTNRTAHVLSAAYCNAAGLIVHTLQYADQPKPVQCVLAARDYVVLELDKVKVCNRCASSLFRFCILV